MRDQGLRGLVKAIKGGRIAYLIPDEDLGDTNSVFSPFFGIPTATVPVVGWLAKMTDAAVVPVFTRMLDNGRYAFDIKPPLPGFPIGDKQADAATVNSVFEAQIRSAPEQALWTFKWFKTRPDNDVSPYH
jgi:lauroyl/myristoyl acyltransferase